MVHVIDFGELRGMNHKGHKGHKERRKKRELPKTLDTEQSVEVRRLRLKITKNRLNNYHINCISKTKPGSTSSPDFA